MTTLFRTILLTAISLLLFPLAGQAAPELPIRKAIELAEESLASKGKAGEVYIAKISWERSTILSKKAVWVITWSETIPGSKPDSKEVGLEINMQGDVVHLLHGRGKKPMSNSPR